MLGNFFLEPNINGVVFGGAKKESEEDEDEESPRDRRPEVRSTAVRNEREMDGVREEEEDSHFHTSIIFVTKKC